MENIQIREIAAWIAVFIFVVMTLFQLLLAFGAPYGNLAWGGKNKILPKNLRIGSFISALLFIIAAISVLEKTNILVILRMPLLVTIFVYLFTVLFGLSTFANIFSKSKLEKLIMTPIAFILFILCLTIALGL